MRWRRLGAGIAGVACLAGGTVLATSAPVGSAGAVAVPESSAAPLPATGGPVTAPVHGVVIDPDGRGYWEYTTSGQVFNFSAPYEGSMGGEPLNAPIVGMAAAPTGAGYWLVGSDGGIFSFGTAAFHGSMGGHPLNQPIVGIAADRATGGYWEVAADGGIFAFTAPYEGSMGGTPLNRPVVGITAAPTGGGYWEVAADGGVFAFGTAGYHGSMGGTPLNEPVVGIAAGPSGTGYWEVAADGGIFALRAPYEGSMGGKTLPGAMTSIAVSSTGAGYYMATSVGGIYAEGAALLLGTVADMAHGSGGAAATDVTAPTGAHPYLPPENPPGNIAADPDYVATGAGAPCWSGGAPSVPEPAASGCIAAELAATDNARTAEGLGQVTLPGNYGQLSAADQALVILDLERVSRGEAPVAGVAAIFDADAQSAAGSDSDPSLAWSSAPGATWFGATWAGGVLNPADADYLWLYDDGWGGSGATVNADCTGPTASGCWDHRDILLSSHAGTLVMGAGSTAEAGGMSSIAALLVAYGPTAQLPALTYTWADALAAGAAA